MFNKETNLKWGEIDHPSFSEFYLNKWIPEDEMTEEEKETDLRIDVMKGCLKTYTWEEAWSNFWRDTTEENRQKFLDLPNFDAEIFKSITGIDVRETDEVEITVDGNTKKISRQSAKALGLI